MINVKRNNVFWWIHRGAKKVEDPVGGVLIFIMT